MRSEKTKISSSQEVFRKVLDSDDLLRRPSSEETTCAIASTALKLAGYKSSDTASEIYRDTRDLQMILLGLTPAALKASRELNNRNRLHPSEIGRYLDEIGRYLDDVIAYNHTLRGLIDNCPRETAHTILTYLNDINMQLFTDPEQIKSACQMSKDVFNGMRHELAAEQMFWMTDSLVDVRSADATEEKRGIDLVVEYDTGQTVGYDVKSSAQGAKERNATSPHNPAIWTGLKWSDFGGRVRLSTSDARKFLPEFDHQLKLAHRIQTIASTA